MTLMFQPLRKYAEFQGRAQRAEFWLFALFIWILEIVLMAIIGGIAGPGAGIGDPAAMAAVTGPAAALWGVFGLIMLGLLVPALAVSVRRLHDTDRSGWWLLIGLIPFLGALALFVFYVLDGTPGANKFGEDPKNRAASGDLIAAA